MARYAAPSGNITSTGDLFIQINSWTSNFFFVAVTFALFFDYVKIKKPDFH